MRFTPTAIEGVFVIEPEPIEDGRGFFARAWCEEELAEQGLEAGFVQANLSFNEHKGTLRGLHYQVPPHAEAKLVRCTRGAICDVALDLRPHSPTYKQWEGVELSASNRRMLYVPEGCAHGYETLAADTEVYYSVSAFYAPEAERGVRYDDPAFGIEWPLPVQVISEKDRSQGPFVESEHALRVEAS